MMDTTNESKIVPGVIYMSFVPPLMSVKKIREIFSQFGQVGRIFLKPDKNQKKGKGRINFTEGWIEFSNKKVAKRVACLLNGTLVGGKRRSACYDSLWSLKYLNKFRWTHLNERLAYEKASRDQKMRTEILQAKREANYYIRAAEKSRKYRKRKSGDMEQCDSTSKTKLPRVEVSPQQNMTDEEMCSKQAVPQNKQNSELLNIIFGNKNLS